MTHGESALLYKQMSNDLYHNATIQISILCLTLRLNIHFPSAIGIDQLDILLAIGEWIRTGWKSVNKTCDRLYFCMMRSAAEFGDLMKEEDSPMMVDLSDCKGIDAVLVKVNLFT